MTLAHILVTNSIKYVTEILCEIDGFDLSKVPSQGPFIIASNHINFLEVPVLYTHLQPRSITGFAKSETWNNPILGSLFDLWEAIPIKRGEADAFAFRSAFDALKEGKILAIAPEGTRSKHGKLQQGHPGIVLLASKGDVPILPLVFYGGEKIKENLSRLRRTAFHIRVGKMFKVSLGERVITHEIRDVVLEEIMYQLALLLPDEYRGYYADINKSTTHYLDFV